MDSLRVFLFIWTTLSFFHYSLSVSFQDASRTWSIFGSITDKRACNWEDYWCYWNVWCFCNVVFLWSMILCFEWPLLPYIPSPVFTFSLGYKFLEEIEYLFPFLVQIRWLTAQDIFQLSSFIPWRGIGSKFLKCYSLCGIGWRFWWPDDLVFCRKIIHLWTLRCLGFLTAPMMP